MSRTLTAADRSALIRLASTMPVGSEERRAILAGLSKKSALSMQKAERILKKKGWVFDGKNVWLKSWPGDDKYDYLGFDSKEMEAQQFMVDQGFDTIMENRDGSKKLISQEHPRGKFI